MQRTHILYLNALVVATCGLVYELLAGTIGSYVLGDSVTQFSLCIGVYLSALGVGAWLSGFVTRSAALVFIEIELAVALLGGFSAPILFLAFANVTSFPVVLYGMVFAVGTLVGLELPLLMRILKDQMEFKDLVSRVLAFDYIGSLAGAVLFPILFVPNLGLMRTSLLFGILNALVAFWGTWVLQPLIPRNLAFLRGCGAVTLAALAIGMIKADSFTTWAEERQFQETVVYTKTSPYQRILITHTPQGFQLYLNGNLQFNSFDEYRYHEALVHPADEITRDLPPDEPDGGDKEAHADALVRRARELLGAEHWEALFAHGTAELVADIRDDLAAFGVEYDEWFSERSLFASQAVERALEQLEHNEYLYRRDGAVWFRSTDFGDEKDRVVVRENADKTYFGADIAYHWNKIERGNRRVIDVLGADHHGYIARMSAALQALGIERERFETLLVQFAVLYRGGEKIPMSTRSGRFVTLRELREEVGTDAARFFYVMRRNDQHLDFDLDLAKAETQDNPVYYIQYAHARIHSVMRQLAAKGLTWDRERGGRSLDRLGSAHEAKLLTALERFPEVVSQAAAERAPHRLCYFLLEDVANAFHTWYNAETFIVDDADLRDARLVLIQATGQVIRNGLGLIGVSAPERM